MVQKEFKTFLTDTLGVDIEALKASMTSDEEVKVEFKSGIFMDDEALTGLKETVKKEGYNEGKVTGVEMEAKRVKEKFNIDVEGKNFDNIFSTFEKQTLTNAKIEPNKKVDELNTSLTNLQKQYTNDLGLKDNEINSLNTKIGEYQINGDLAKHLPELKGIKPNQFATLARTEYAFDYVDGNMVVKKGDTILKDKLEKPLPVKDVLTLFATQNGWTDKDGRGGSDEGGGSGEFKSMDDVYKHMDENKIDPLGADGQKLIADFQKT